MKVWFVDDQAANRAHWRNSFPQGIADLELRTFRDVPSILAALAQETPDILFIDFYLEDRTGQEVIDSVRDDGSRAGKSGPVLIAHSSLDSANGRMTAKGADFTVPKVKENGVIRAIARAIRTQADLETIVRTRRWPAAG